MKSNEEIYNQVKKLAEFLLLTGQFYIESNFSNDNNYIYMIFKHHARDFKIGLMSHKIEARTYNLAFIYKSNIISLETFMLQLPDEIKKSILFNIDLFTDLTVYMKK